MQFPNDIYAKTKRGGRMTDADKAKILMGGLFVVNVGLTILGLQFFNSLGIPLILVILVQIVIYVLVCIQIFRYMVYREQDRDLEDSDLFMPYYKFRPGSTVVKTHIVDYETYELKNSSYVSAFTLKFGMSNNERALNTEIFLNKIQDLIFERNLKCRFIILNENFVESEEANLMLSKANAIADPQLRATQLAIYNDILNFAETRGSAVCINVMVYATNKYFCDDLEDAIVQIVNLYKKMEDLMSFRKIEFLDQVKLLSLFKSFYGLDAIDLSLSKIQYDSVHPDILDSIIVYRVISKEGKVYTNPVFNDIKTGVRFIKK